MLRIKKLLTGKFMSSLVFLFNWIFCLWYLWFKIFHLFFPKTNEFRLYWLDIYLLEISSKLTSKYLLEFFLFRLLSWQLAAKPKRKAFENIVSNWYSLQMWCVVLMIVIVSHISSKRYNILTKWKGQITFHWTLKKVTKLSARQL